jgi:hypothetical protein
MRANGRQSGELDKPMSRTKRRGWGEGEAGRGRGCGRGERRECGSRCGSPGSPPLCWHPLGGCGEAALHSSDMWHVMDEAQCPTDGLLAVAGVRL